jgi:hypothetical protein
MVIIHRRDEDREGFNYYADYEIGEEIFREFDLLFVLWVSLATIDHCT